jgi:phage repressor protein C with HTH and peptisase S24 domain
MANQIRTLRRAKDITLEELSEMTGISSGHLQRMETGNRGLSLENVLKIAKALGCEPIDVSNEFDHEHLETAATMPMPTPSHSKGDIPEIDVMAGLGGGGLSIVENTTVNGVTFHREAVRDHWRFPSWVFARLGVEPQYIAAFQSKGDSMLPTILDGDVVFADTRHRVPSPPGVYVLADEFGGVIVKRLEVTSRPGDEIVTVLISSDNKLHRERELTLGEIEIIGRYIGRFTI